MPLESEQLTASNVEYQAMLRGLTRGSKDPGGAWLVTADAALHEQILKTAKQILPEKSRLIFTRDKFEEYFADGAHTGLQLLLGGQTGRVNPHHIVIVLTSQELNDLLNSNDPYIAWVIEDAHHRFSGSYTLKDE